MTEALTDIVRQFTGAAYRLIVRITGDPDEAKDLTQEVMVKMLTRDDRLREPAKLKSYILRSAYNAALNAARSRKRREQAHRSFANSVPQATVTDPTDMVHRQRRERELNAAITRLAERQREVITLRYYSDLTMAEIAASLKISEGTARVHLARALDNLKTILISAVGEEL